VQIIDNILPDSVNEKVIEYLCNHGDWSIGKENNFSAYELIQKNRFVGLSLESQNNSRHVFLNTVALIITEKVKSKLNLDNYSPSRFFWNFYYPGDFSMKHTDDLHEKSVSIIYNLNTTLGGTFINDKFYVDKAGQAKVFKSNIFHSGSNQNNKTCRLNLNIILKPNDLIKQ